MQHPPFTVRTIYGYECCLCKNTIQQEWLGTSAPFPDHPGAGWQQFGTTGPSIWVCPNHNIVILIDGKEFNPNERQV